MKNWVFVIGVLALSLIACDDFSYVGKANDVPTAGRVKVGFDRGDSMMVVQWLEMFHAKYPQASIIPVFKETDELVEHWMKDSIQGVFLHKKFSQEELNWLEDKKNATINEVPMGTTSVVFITNPNSKINSIDFYSSQTNWNEVTHWIIRSKNMKGFRSLKKDTLLSNVAKKALFNKRIKETSSDVNTINSVLKEPNSLGIISLNTIADKRDSLSVALKRKVKVVPVLVNNEAQYPFQSQIAAKQYPYTLPLISYESQGYSGLIKGLVIYTNSQAGQALLQKSGLIPANYQGRKIQVKVD